MAETSLFKRPSADILFPQISFIYRNSLNREPGFPNQLGRTTGSEQTDILLVEALGEVKETGLVIDRDNGCSSQNVTLASEDRKEKVHSGEVSDSMEQIIQILGMKPNRHIPADTRNQLTEGKPRKD